MARPTRAAGPKYPGVVAYDRADGVTVYKAQHVRRSRGRCVCVHIGTYDDPLYAYYEVINARANVAETRATSLRGQANQILGEIVRRRSHAQTTRAV